MYYLAEINEFNKLVIKDSSNSDFCEIFNNSLEVHNKFGKTVLGVGFENVRVTTKAELGIIKYIDSSDYSWVQKVIDYDSTLSKELCITDAGFNFKGARPEIVEGGGLVTLPMLIIKYLSKSVISNFLYVIDNKLYVLADYQKLDDGKSYVCEYRAYNIKDRTKFDIAITKGVIRCK